MIRILWTSHKQGRIGFLSIVLSKWDRDIRYCNRLQPFLFVICIYRSIDSHTLIGNIGGYIGLFLGYNFLQIPALITKFFKHRNFAAKALSSIEKSANEHDEEQNNTNNDD